MLVPLSRVGRSLTFRGKNETARRKRRKGRRRSRVGTRRKRRKRTRIKKETRRKTRTYNALFVAARFKGKRTLLDISIRDEHATFGRERRKNAGERTVERKGRWKVEERGKRKEEKGRARGQRGLEVGGFS